MFCSMVKLPTEASNFTTTDKKLYKFGLSSLSESPFTEMSALCEFNETCLPSEHASILEEIRNFEVFQDDIWILAYPKCGTTLIQEAIWQILNEIEIKGDGKKEFGMKFYFLELSSISPPSDQKSQIKSNNEMERPRLIESHLPIAFLPKQLWTVKPKIVFVTREVKDVAISFYHHYVHSLKYEGTKNEFLDLFLDGHVLYGSYWSHFQQFNLIRENYKNMKLIQYEDLKRNLAGTLTELCSFLEKPLPEEKLQVLEENLKFSPNHHDTDEIDSSIASETLTCCDKIGFYKDEMPPEFIEKFNEITLQRLGIDFIEVQVEPKLNNGTN
uniref:CSON007826 protein n=1 Tax=Culicoides sonorensis TaxID=179676 RepID=A0A336M1Q5_CULSO